jgi:hypothetical protein
MGKNHKNAIENMQKSQRKIIRVSDKKSIIIFVCRKNSSSLKSETCKYDKN